MRSELEIKILEIIMRTSEISALAIPEQIWDETIPREQALFQLGLVMGPMLQEGLIEEVPGRPCVYRSVQVSFFPEGFVPSSLPPTLQRRNYADR